MDTQRNEILAALLTSHGYTHRQLAQAVNAISGRIFGRPGAATDRDVRRWISGAVRWPTSRYLLPLVEIFDRQPEAMGFVPRGRSSRLPVPPPRTPTAGEEEPVKRRAFLTASTAATVALALGLDETPVQGRLTLTDIDRATGKIGRLAAHFNSVGGGALLEVATVYLDRLRTAADGCTYGPRVEQALNAAISDLCSSAGWAAHDAGQSGQARLLYADALQSAILAEDKRGQARAWSNLALQARLDGRHREALRVNRAALDSRQARQDPRIAALLHSRLAIGHARAGDPPAAARSLLAAEAAHDKFDTAAPPPPWLRFLDAAEIAGLSAIAHQAMGHLPDAELATAQALQMLAPNMHRNRAYYGVQLAELQVAQGDTDRAALTVARLNTSALSSRRIADRLATVHRALAA
ncbi:twin-arginine translocation signal domain-containing protein [Streptomyces sp. NPDC087263]|uniref:twin-arginine translocation signal domain-containing protein n=1 Tax=Streptomyces sp. NPDC087263 TaxID=3365773 RepID=UPI00381B82CD